MTEALRWAVLYPGGLYLLALTCGRRERVPGAWLFAGAMAVSFVGETLSMSGLEWNWWPSYFWLPVQLLLALTIVADRRALRGTALVLVTLLIYDVAVSAPRPDVLLTAVGSVVLLYVLTLVRHPLTIPLALYFGAGTACYILWVADRTIPWWWAYQTVRVLAWASYLLILYTWPRRRRWPT